MSYAKPEAVSCKYGAPMGRRTWCAVTPDEKVRVKLSRMPLDSGGYDAGGAYWGYPNDLWWMRDGELAINAYYRAPNRKAAAAKAIEQFPSVVFIRRP